VSLAVALRLLEAGDIFSRLRSRIRATKPRTVALLEEAGLRVVAGHPDVPAAVVDDSDGSASRLFEPLGIRGLRPALAPGARAEAGAILHLRTPIDDGRIDLLERLLAGAPKAIVSAAGGRW
jgi:hypothetical protein